MGGGLQDHVMSIAAEEPADHPDPCATTEEPLTLDWWRSQPWTGGGLGYGFLRK